jgi:hypothetical protein
MEMKLPNSNDKAAFQKNNWRDRDDYPNYVDFDERIQQEIGALRVAADNEGSSALYHMRIDLYHFDRLLQTDNWIPSGAQLSDDNRFEVFR